MDITGKTNPELKEYVIDLHLKGHTVAEIMKETYVGKNAVHNILSYTDIKTEFPELVTNAVHRTNALIIGTKLGIHHLMVEYIIKSHIVGKTIQEIAEGGRIAEKTVLEVVMEWETQAESLDRETG